ncbi:MAG: 1-acyl-sn-glycerol-3-phosphate acyltransferase [Muribaculaceae bacterium]|nr:1-acyl-sn-glycerol-3-phosphate acyltransferase [Muribaculaceae bacterium]
MQISLSSIIRARLGKEARFIPGFLLRSLERIIRQDDLNAMLAAAHPAKGSEFSSRILAYLEISVEVQGLDKIPVDQPLIFASNHPLGGLDGITLVSILGAHYGDDNIRVLVNDLLLNVEPLRDVFLPVNKFGSQGREASRLLQQALSNGKQLVMFPAGLVSRLHPDGRILDLEWQKSFVSLALRHSRRIIPIHFEALNSPRFYKTALWRKRLHIPFNLEQVLLPSELVRARRKHYRITFLPPVDPAELKDSGLTPAQIAARIREFCYLKKNH